MHVVINVSVYRYMVNNATIHVIRLLVQNRYYNVYINHLKVSTHPQGVRFMVTDVRINFKQESPQQNTHTHN